MTKDAWIELPHHKGDRLWDRFTSAFRFNPSVYPRDWPSFVEPAPSLTWDVGHLLREFQPWTDDRTTPYNLALLAALRAHVGEDEPVFALDWQHAEWEFYPHRLRKPDVVRNWLIPALPSGEYHLFVTDDFRLGSLGHPWEQTVCVFGEGFVESYRALTPLGNDRLVRQKMQNEGRAHEPKRREGQRCPRRRGRRVRHSEPRTK
jgi:hypothetical protein